MEIGETKLFMCFYAQCELYEEDEDLTVNLRRLKKALMRFSKETSLPWLKYPHTIKPMAKNSNIVWKKCNVLIFLPPEHLFVFCIFIIIDKFLFVNYFLQIYYNFFIVQKTVL